MENEIYEEELNTLLHFNCIEGWEIPLDKLEIYLKDKDSNNTH